MQSQSGILSILSSNRSIMWICLLGPFEQFFIRLCIGMLIVLFCGM